MRNRQFSSGSASRVALGGVLAALSLLLLYLASMMPSGRLGLVAVAGLVPAAAVVSAGYVGGFLCYGAAGILGLLLLPEKGCAVLYLVLFGLYPMVKSAIERLRKLPLELVLKLVFFNLVLTVLVLVFSKFLFPMLPELLQSTWILYAAGNVVFLIYDYGFSKLITFYTVRVHRIVRKHR